MSKILELESITKIQSEISKIDTDLLLVVIDHRVNAEYFKLLNLKSFEGKKVHLYKASDGENSKSFSEYEKCLEFFISKGVHRNAHLVAIGGGALSDMAGFVAATLLRGIKWTVIPTTLLSMIDASIGGKVAINTNEYKNLVGSFHLPENVLICHEFLQTLPEVQKLSGLGELVKYCFLDSKIAKSVEDKKEIKDIIFQCANYKQKIVEEDLKEGGLRKILNLGHTFGHAIEKTYDIPHGIAVIWGMVVMFKVLERTEMLNKLSEFVKKLDIEIGPSPWLNKTFPIDNFMDQIKKDKKKQSNASLDIVDCEKVGKPKIFNKNYDELEKLLNNHKDELRTYVV